MNLNTLCTNIKLLFDILHSQQAKHTHTHTRLSGRYVDNVFVPASSRTVPEESVEWIYKFIHRFIEEFSICMLELVVTETPPADLSTSPAASAFEKDGVRRTRRSYIFVHLVYDVHDNYTN